MGHTSFESGESSKMNGGFNVISRERSTSTSVMSGLSSGFESEISVSRSFKFSVQPFKIVLISFKLDFD
jgi:hypothetical protein